MSPVCFIRLQSRYDSCDLGKYCHLGSGNKVCLDKFDYSTKQTRASLSAQMDLM